MLPNKLAFIDLETTGTSPTRDRVIEIGILKVVDDQVVEKFESLIDPDMFLPPEITTLTGIHAHELESAPNFRSIKEKIDELTEGAIVVAHNARFDVSFLKAEYDRLGEHFKNKSLCTARLSRSLFPRFHHHNLDSIIDRYGFVCEGRHRAFGDAKVLWDFYQMLQKNVENDKLTEAVMRILKKTSLPNGLKEEIVDKLPKKPGVYIFYGENGAPLYVGKSVNIHDRVLSHFSSTHTSGRELSIANQVNLIEHEVTDGEMAALIREKKLIESLQPIYNRQLRLLQKMVVLKKTEINGYDSLEITESSEINPDSLDSVLGVFKSRSRAKDALNTLSDEYALCHKLLGLETGEGACFRSQIEKCNGACKGHELPIKYNLRFAEAFSRLKIKQWPFRGPVLFNDGGVGHLIYRWCYLGQYDDESLNELRINPEALQFDFDTYKILSKFLLKEKSNLKIKEVFLG